MLNNRADSGSSRQNGSDPWQTPYSVPKKNTVAEIWSSLTETTPLISPAGNPEAPRLVSHRSTSEEILLEDELKLKTSAGSLLKQQMEKALTLLYWLETIGQPNPDWQMSSN